MIRLKLPGLGVVSYHKDKPPDTIYFESVIGNKNYSSVIFPINSECDWTYERVSNEKLFKLRKV
jgi:hypothetical protein